MGIVNRRNAVLGWTVWNMTKRIALWKAKAARRGTAEGTKRPNKSAIVSVALAALGAMWFWRTKSGDRPDEE